MISVWVIAHSNISRRFPIDTVKIDREFIARIDPDRQSIALIDAILAMAQSIDAEVVAEGVETPQQLEFLQGKACRYAQGHYFCKPVTAAQFEEMIGNAASSVASLSLVQEEEAASQSNGVV